MTSVTLETAPFRDADFMPVDLAVETRDDGTIVFQSNTPMPDHDGNLARTIRKSAQENADSIALAERGPDGAWIEIDYKALLDRVLATAQWMIDTVPRGRAFMILSENSIDTAIFNVACYFAGLIHTPVSPSFVMTGDYERLRHVAGLTEPAAIFVSSTKAFAKAVETVLPPETLIVTAAPENFSRPTTAPKDIYETSPTAAVEEHVEGIDPDNICTYMMTSGSTGLPKVVTLSMAALSANTAQTYAAVGQAAGWDDVMLDWLPWHHAAGLSVLRSGLVYGGSLYIDAGKPLPGLIDTTIQNLTEISVAYFNNVPTGYAMLVEAMETNAALKASFFKKMRLMLYGGAGLAQPVYDRLQEMAIEETGHRIHMTTGYGMTETVSGCMTIHYPTRKVGIGLPCPGVVVKLIPTDDRFEVRLKGPNLMSGYLKAPEKNAEVFDEEGFYRTGDLARLIVPDDLSEGLAFAGRMAEEFKLLSGSWVYGGELKARLLKFIGEDVMEGVLCDANRPYLTLMLWARPGRPEGQAERIARAISEFNRGPGGQSTTIQRFTLLSSPPDAAAHEMSDKGTINRRAVLANRQSILDELYADPAPSHVVTIAPH
jgi:feruloyl-CoA synthase